MRKGGGSMARVGPEENKRDEAIDAKSLVRSRLLLNYGTEQREFRELLLRERSVEVDENASGSWARFSTKIAGGVARSL